MSDIKMNLPKVEKGKIITIIVPDGMEIDKEKSSDTEIVFRKKQALPKKWADIKYGDFGAIKGFYTDVYGNTFDSCTSRNPMLQTWFATEEQAKASIALSKLSQLRQIYLDSYKGEFKNFYTIDSCLLGWSRTEYRRFLSFPTSKLADEFLNNFEDLIREASVFYI